ncbi:Ig-like domain-containing protein [Maribacter luteus]|uniref:Ig-like domain-containing protein n=1 Tax=Maribacter luteus TaxID=2594478 RepID=UPI0024916D50|nr:tandem-95 repeat protein [Maribacter luteus]
MNKKRRSPIYFILMLIILIACTKQVGLVTEVEFDLSENYTSEGYVNEPLATTLTVVPEELIEGYIYDYRYTVLSGEGHFEDANGEEVPQGERRPFDPLSKSLNYIGSTVGAHTVRVQATDTYGFTEELELTYILSEVPVTWTATIADSELLVGYQTTVTVTLGNEGTGNATYERNYSISTGSGALTQSDGTGVGLDGYEGITPGTYQYGFVPDALGAVTLTFDLRDSNGQELTASVNLEVVEELSSGENDIIAFTLPEQNGTSLIDDQAHTVSVTVPMGTTLTTAPTVLTVSEGATVTPDMATQQDFTVPVIYTVTAENEEVQEWTVTVIEEATSTDPEITLIGGDITLTVGDTYVEEGATAMDAEDLDISGDIVIDASAVDTNTAGSYQVTYNVTDSDGNPATEVLRTVTVNAVVNEAPTANNFTVTVEGDSTDNPIDVAGEISDPENDPLTVSIQTGSPANGTATVSGTVISYTPNNGYTGNDVITYLVDDGNNPAVSATITVMVNAVVNEAPTANNFTVTVEGNSTNNPIDVASEISDPENDPLTVSIQTGSPLNGTASISGTVISYTPNNGYTGNDVITYLVDDGNNPAVSATITVMVNAVVNEAPTANNFTVMVEGNSTNNSINVASEISDPENDPLTVSIQTGSPANGTATISGTVISYTPNNGFSGNDVITYLVDDGNNPVVSATITVTVNEVGNIAPTANNFNYTVERNSMNNLIEVNSEISDPENDPLTVSIQTGSPANGMATVTGTEISYTPNNGFSGNDVITYLVHDGNNPAVSATITMTVENQAPVAIASALNTTGTVPFLAYFTGSDSYDPNPGDTDILTYEWDFGDGTTSNTFSPGHNYTSEGTYSVTLTVSDGQLSDVANLEIVVTAAPNVVFSDGNRVDNFTTSISGTLIVSNIPAALRLTAFGGAGGTNTNIIFTIEGIGSYSLYADAYKFETLDIPDIIPMGSYNYTISGTYVGSSGNYGSVDEIP